ncbi:hypothetical protein EVAR_38536_1 [Eumeta japonica]|uniref:Uncharacterized protein n=1 Tax=Eumeta variegata TaxID=151549 RepID=A0A4C1WBX0_EUMVA|nr:hypothetical protein EVAR_38536_1 [Eumeta japonica]
MIITNIKSRLQSSADGSTQRDACIQGMFGQTAELDGWIRGSGACLRTRNAYRSPTARVWSSRRTIKGYVRSAAARGSDAANATVEEHIRRRSREDDLEIARYNDVLVTSPQQRQVLSAIKHGRPRRRDALSDEGPIH